MHMTLGATQTHVRIFFRMYTYIICQILTYLLLMIRCYQDITGGRGEAGFLSYDVPEKNGYSMVRYDINPDTGAPLNPLKNEGGYGNP